MLSSSSVNTHPTRDHIVLDISDISISFSYFIAVIDSYVTIERKNGDLETIKPWNENAVVLAPTTQLGWTYYKPVPMVRDTDAYQVQGSYYKMTRYSELNPMQEVTMAEAYVQPALINRASLVFMNITKTNWNGGK